ncbi:hypothetical protein G6F57_020516 [Rhizopus arrhizus]|nr:hypothetical protein G6F68_021479 [Rhizopus microsporus]KAG1436785.1 hypothetical protein G6F57_020516 [Rhizopus arrhizus]
MGRNRRHAQARHDVPGRLPVLARPRRLSRAQPVRRRAGPPAAGAPVRAPRQRAGAGRTHQRPGHRNAGTAGRAASGIRRHRAARQP